ncbi:MAG: fumarylacetoacetate hydrolase family protein [Candidatus Hermodarchaeota archaeon]
MRLATIRLDVDSSEVAALVTAAGIFPIKTLNQKLRKNWPEKMLDIIAFGHLEEIKSWYHSSGKDELKGLYEYVIPFESVSYAPLYRYPRKIWGIGLNYKEHAHDLSEKSPTTEPASFMKPDTTIIGHEDVIKIPLQSEKTTGEAELGVIIGKKCKNVKRENWLSVVAGFTNIIDMTAEDILRKNPRYLTLSKSFDTFFSFGPHLVTPDEIENIMNLKVATVINGKVHAQNSVSNMTFPPDYLVSFHSKVMTLLPGDIISTGTPRAVHLNNGDVIECRIDGFASLVNNVVDLKD